MIRSLLLCLLPVVICETELRINVNDGIEYDGTSNVRYQKTYPPPLHERPQSIPISPVTVSPSSTSQAPASRETYKPNQFEITTQSSPSYIPRRKPFHLPRPTKPWSMVNFQATEQPIVAALKPTLYVSNIIPQIQSDTSEPQPSTASAPQVVIQLVSNPQTPPNTTLQKLAIVVPVGTGDGKPSATASPIDAIHPNTQLLTNDVSSSKSFAAEHISFESVPESSNKSEHQPILPAEAKVDPLSVHEQIPQLERQSNLQSNTNYPSSKKVVYPIKMRPQITFVPILDDTSAEETDSIILPEFSDASQKPATNEMAVPEIAPIQMSSGAANSTLKTDDTYEPIIVAPPNPTIVEILSPPVVSSPKTESNTGPKVIIQLITNSQLPLNSHSLPPLDVPSTTTFQPAVITAQLNTSTVLQSQSPVLSILDTELISEKTIQPNHDFAFYVPQPEQRPVPDTILYLEKDLTSLTKSQTTDEPKTNIAIQSQPITIKPQSTFAPLSRTDPDPETFINAFTNAPPSRPHDSHIPPNSYVFGTYDNGKPSIASRFNIPDHTIVYTTNKFSLNTTVSSPNDIPESQPSTESNIQFQEVSSSHETIQTDTTSQSLLFDTPQSTILPALKPLAAARSDQPLEFFDLNLSDYESELETPAATSLETEQVDQPVSEIDPHIESKTASQSKAEITFRQYYPIKLRPQVTFGAIPDPVYKPPATNPNQTVLPPLLPRPKPIREPAYGRFTHNTTQYPPGISPSIISPTRAPPLIKPYTIWQPNYGSYLPATTTNTQYPNIVTTQSTTRAPPVNTTSTLPTQRPGSFKLDFVCKDGNGYYAVDNECGSYILCQENNVTKFSCPDGLYFNPAAKYNEYPCTYSWRAQCSDGTGNQYPTRQCPKKYGLFSMNDGDCSKYLMCNVGVATIMNCPVGLVFNPTTESCDYVANVPRCNPQVFKNYVCPAPPVDEYGVDTDIIYKYKYGDQCKLYIACQRGYPRLLSCEPGLAFDEATQSCINAKYVPNCAPYTT